MEGGCEDVGEGWFRANRVKLGVANLAKIYVSVSDK